jgi:hypothetical protein
MGTRARLGFVTTVLWLLLGAPRAGAQASGRDADSTASDSAAADGRGKRGKPDKRVRRKPAISGYVQVFYKGRREANGDGATEPSVFRVQRVRIELRGDAARHVAYDVEIDPRAPSITGVLRDAFISLDYIPRHEIRIGQQKTLFGYENPTSSTRLFVVNRAEVSDNISRGVTLRDIGLGLVGSIPLSERFRLEDAVTLVNGSGMNVQADSTARKNVWGRLGVRYRSAGRDLTVRFGVSAASGDQQSPVDSGPPLVPPFTISFRRFGTDLEIDHPLGFLAAEFASSNDRAPKELGDVAGGIEGYYVLLAGKTRWNVGPVFRWDVFDAFRRLTAGAYVGRPSDDVSLLLNYEVFRDDAGKHDDRYYARLQVRL